MHKDWEGLQGTQLHLSEDGAELSPCLLHQKQPGIKRFLKKKKIKSNQIRKITRTFAAGSAGGEGGMPGRSLCSERVPRKGMGCDSSEGCQEHPRGDGVGWGHPGLLARSCGAHQEPPEPWASTELREWELQGVGAALCRWHHSSSSASPTVCHQLCSGCRGGNAPNHVIAAEISELRLPGQAESPQQGWGRMATSNGGAGEERE